jgi:hypothetical protein
MEEENWADHGIHSNYEPTCKAGSAVESILCHIMPDCHFHWSPVLLLTISTPGNVIQNFQYASDLCPVLLICVWLLHFVSHAVILIRANHFLFIWFWQMQDGNCIVLNWNFATGLAVVRSVTDAIYFLHMLLQVSSSIIILLLFQISFYILSSIQYLSLIHKLLQRTRWNAWYADLRWLLCAFYINYIQDTSLWISSAVSLKQIFGQILTSGNTEVTLSRTTFYCISLLSWSYSLCFAIIVHSPPCAENEEVLASSRKNNVKQPIVPLFYGII